MFDSFLEHFLWYFNIAFPKTRSTPKNIGWRNKLPIELIKESEDLQHLYYLSKLSENPNLLNTYKIRKNELSKKISAEKIKQSNSLIHNSKNPNKTMWLLVNNTRKSRPEDSSLSLLHDNHSITDACQIVNIFGEYYSHIVSTKLAEHFPNGLSATCTLGKSNINSLFFSEVSAEEVQSVIAKIPNKNSTGADEVPVSVIKCCGDLISQQLAVLINKSVAEGVFPQALKGSIVVPIYKNKGPRTVENFRPVALLSVFSKILEKIVHNRVYSFLSKFNLLTKCQHGFRPGFSTKTLVADFVQNVYDKLDTGQFVVAVMFDLSKAFDTLNIKFFSEKISKLGVRGSINDWLVSFLSNRQFAVRLEGTNSKYYGNVLGTPQGSVLGPLIFLLFVNDLPDFISEGLVFIYADDVTILLSDKDLASLSRKLDYIAAQFNDWCSKNNLIINHDKTTCLEFFNSHKSPSDIKFKFNGYDIGTNGSAKLLGVIFDQNLRFDEHIQQVCSKLSSHYFLLLSLRRCMDIKALIEAYYAICHSTISYNILIWGCSSDMVRVLLAQKRIVRLIFNLPYGTSSRDHFKIHNILTVTSVYILQLLSYIFENKQSFILNKSIHQHNTRQRDNFRLQAHQHTFYEKSPVFAGCKLFNKLPEELKNAPSITTFNRKLKHILFEQTFYSIKEFEDYIR